MLYDVIIIGGGPAGLTAGLYSSRARMKSLLIEQALSGGQIIITEWIENYPGFDEGISGTDLAQRMEKQAVKFGLEKVWGTVIDISLEGDIKRITLENGTVYETKSIILATGAHPKALNIPGEKELRGKGVSYCATCDGAFFKDEDVAVIGGGDSALEEAVFLARFARTVYIIHRRSEFRAVKITQERASLNPKLKFIFNSVAEKIEGEKSVTALHIKNLETGKKSVLDVSGVFIYVGYTPNTGFLKGLAALDEENYIIADCEMTTSVPGIFAAGDVRTKSLKQIAAAVGDGAVAAVAAEKYISINY